VTRAPREPLRPAREVALDLAVATGVHEESAAARMLVDAVERLRAEGRDAALRPFEELFAGGPDTACATTWRREAGTLALSEVSEVPLTECVEVPLDELRAAFDAAGGSLT
jgi:hypothetical protein